MKYFLILFLAGITFYSCNSDSPVTNNNTEPTGYNKIANIESGITKFEIWSASGLNMCYGYNDLGFKVFINGEEKNSGFVKFKPMMFHFIGNTGHSSPRSEYFYYNSTSKLFTGYVCFSMISDSTDKWVGYFNYNNENHLDSLPISILSSSSAQQIWWDDILGGNTYVLTLINPKTPALGLNDFECLLHRDINEIDFVEKDSAQMIIKPWMVTHGHGSSNNVNPVWQGNGRYKGKANFTMQGGWLVYDTIKVNDVLITKDKTPKFSFDVR